eukprot:TRINITY_DN10410_c0_g1_i1.p1 TRINITY_DN10410_c0_g1~~TRINITY_DN10410_c0_g1_i1.p1  ORF type:complete len:125 (-),score=11.41 TRINITY_DN10410_c0_g1_i1:247-621(-)
MKGLLVQNGRQVRECMLGCKGFPDSVEHYAACPIFWKFACSPRPQGLGIHSRFSGSDGFLLVVLGMSEADQVRVAVGAYALYRVVLILRHKSAQYAEELNIQKVLWLWCRKGAEGSKAARLMRW